MICEKCNNDHDGLFGSGRFCSRGCANSRIQTKEMNESRRKKLKTSVDKYCIDCNKLLDYRNTTGYCTVCIHNQYFYRQKLSESIKGKSGGIRLGGGRGKSGWYKNYWCDSSWELAYVIYNLEHNIKFERNKEGFEYIFEGKTFKYYPDFIIEDGSYIEVKGYMDEKNEAKHKYFSGILNVLMKNEMKPYLDYVINKYSKDFIKLYEQ